MKKSQNEAKSDFFNYINSKCKASEKEENAILKLNLLITNSFKPEDAFDDSKDNRRAIEQQGGHLHSETYQKIEETLKDLTQTKVVLNSLNSEIEGSFAKLNSILKSRNTLSVILKDFNTSTKAILSDKEKMTKLVKGIESIYKTYEQTKSFQAFLENNDCVLKHRFLSDYEEIEKGISFFTMNSNYTEAQNYLQTYNTQKIISINKYYSFLSEGMSGDLVVQSTDEFFNEILKAVQAEHKQLFYYPKGYERMRTLSEFFEKKAKDDSELKKTHDKLKQKFLEARTAKMTVIFDTIYQNINSSYYDSPSKTHFEIISFELSQVLLYALTNVVHYGLMFNVEFRKDVYILKQFTSSIFTRLYDTIRPIIVSLVSLEELIALFDAFRDNFGIFFIDLDNSKSDSSGTGTNRRNSIPTEDNAPVDPIVFAKLILFLANYFEINCKASNVSNEVISKEANVRIIVHFLQISKYLIRPTVLHLIQDIQEKIYFKINQHVKSDFSEIEADFPSFGLYEQKLYSKYSHFALFHFFLKRIVILYEIFKAKLDDKILADIIVSSIETFISILNKEILKNKNLSYEFEIYIIQQILLCLHIVEGFKIDTIESGIQLDFGFVAEMFRANYEALVNGKLTVSEAMTNSAPKVLDASKDFKKILYNNLFKSYKIFINLSNDFIFKRAMMEVYHKIQSKAAAGEVERLVIEKRSEIIEVVGSIEEKCKEVLRRFSVEIKIINKEVYFKIEKVTIDNVMNIFNTVHRYILNMKPEVIGDEVVTAFKRELNLACSMIESCSVISQEK